MPRPELLQRPLRGLFSAPDHVRHTNTVQGIASQFQPGMPGECRLEAVRALRVSQDVLGHAARPALDPTQTWRAARAKPGLDLRLSDGK